MGLNLSTLGAWSLLLGLQKRAQDVVVHTLHTARNREDGKVHVSDDNVPK